VIGFALQDIVKQFAAGVLLLMLRPFRVGDEVRIGDFAGDRAIRAVARYLKSVGASVSAFYLSNVEQFLLQDGKWNTFCASASTLPLDETSVFIRSGRGPGGFGGGVQNSSTAGMLADLQPCVAASR